MTLIEIFTDYVVNKKSLREYVEVRKTINARGEFNDKSLIQAQQNLDRLKEDDCETYDEMYKTLNSIINPIIPIPKESTNIHVTPPISFLVIPLTVVS